MNRAITPSLNSSYYFDRQVLDCVVGGVSALDIARLNIRNRDEARQFVASYGYDIDDPENLQLLQGMHRRAVALIREQLLEPGEEIPAELADPDRLEHLLDLLIIASSQRREEREQQRWACAILRVIHVYVHLRNDLFSAFRDEIQGQILNPLQDAIVRDDLLGSTFLGPGLPDGGIRLHKFEIKPFKTTASSVVKLLARPERVALTLLDKLGVRFVTRNVYDSFRVIQFLIESHLVSYPHIIPDQSNNTLYPVNLFLEVMEDLRRREEKGSEIRKEEVEELLGERLEKEHFRAEFLEKSNQFSGPEHRFIKFINRKLITVKIGPDGQQRAFRFFYPFEIQIVDHETYSRSLMGPESHNEYKARQKLRARDRVLGEL